MLCHGARAAPTTFELTVFKLKDHYLDPKETPSSAQEAADRQAFWQQLAQEMMVNPVLPKTGPNSRKRMRILKQVKFIIQPSLTTEVDSNPSSRMVRMFVPDGRVCDYLYTSDPQTGAGADDKINTTQWVQSGRANADYSETPKPQHRVWFMIRATDTTEGGVIDNTNTPSYDIVVRKKEARNYGL